MDGQFEPRFFLTADIIAEPARVSIVGEFREIRGLLPLFQGLVTIDF